eukprot:gene7296-biopygen17107
MVDASPRRVGCLLGLCIFAPPPTRSANLAQEDVLAAHRQASSPLPPTVADSVGSLSVAMSECRKALKQSPPGKSPGPDGIPVELYRTFADIFTPLLCRLFTAMGTRETLPHNFLEGLLIILHKGEDHLNPGNYRPITLLNSDYKLLAKVLANRLGPVLPQIISSDQPSKQLVLLSPEYRLDLKQDPIYGIFGDSLIPWPCEGSMDRSAARLIVALSFSVTLMPLIWPSPPALDFSSFRDNNPFQPQPLPRPPQVLIPAWRLE